MTAHEDAGENNGGFQADLERIHLRKSAANGFCAYLVFYRELLVTSGTAIDPVRYLVDLPILQKLISLNCDHQWLDQH